MNCEKCDVECTVKGYRKSDCSTGHDEGYLWKVVNIPGTKWWQKNLVHLAVYDQYAKALSANILISLCGSTITE